MASARGTFSSILLSVLVHGVILGLLVVGFLNFSPSLKPQPAQIPIEASVVNEQDVRKEMRRQQQEEEQKARQKQEEERRAEELRQQREAEEKRLDDLRQQREAEEQAEKERAEQRQKEEEAQKAQAEAEAKKKAEQLAADKKRKEADTRRKAEDARLKAEREAELKRQMAEEERRTQAVNAGQLNEYTALIRAKIQRAWIRPPTARAGLSCVVYVTQVPGGEVTSVRVGECNGDDIVRQSIEAAVYRASPLPPPPDEALFERNLQLVFKPDE
jgi:colicin import membrane protein